MRLSGAIVALLLSGCIDTNVLPGKSSAVAYPMDRPVEARAGIVIDRAADGLFYVNATINGRKMRFLVDTGASVVVLTPEDARSLGVRTEGSAGSAIETASGSAAMEWATLKNIRLGNRHIPALRAAVVRNSLETSLLGQNALAQLGTFSISGDQLTLN